MPVRIYEIAKKLGIESKAVLAKAKELGIANARVASSTLDKITAEYLEQHLPQPETQAPPPTSPEPVPEQPAAVPIKIVTEATPDEVTEAQVIPAPEPEIPAPEPAAEPPAPEEIAAVEAAETTPPPQAGEEPAMAVAEPPPPTEAAPPAPEAVEAAAATESTDLAELPASTEAVAPAEAKAEPIAPPPPPPPPPKPAIGEKVGFIQLPSRYKIIEKSTAPKPGKAGPRPAPPQRPEQPRVDRRQRPQHAGRHGHGPPPRKEAVSAKGPGMAAQPSPNAQVITMKPPIIVRDLAERLNRKPFQIIADLMEVGVFATVNNAVDENVAVRICAKHNFRFELEKRDRSKQIHLPAKKIFEPDPDDRPEDLKPRAPVVTIMGHVDHGKTTLLDVIRKSDVVAGEAGGITQHIGAYTISFPHPEDRKKVMQITFLDTPGHAAFSSMRARGANVTDIVVLVVAAEDGVMPQTIEALNHAQAAKVPILVAVNKCDHPAAQPLRVRQQLNERGLIPDDWGGDTIFVDCSALTKKGVDKLLEMILLQADLLELKANPNRRAMGNVIESGLEPGGPTATVLVRKGTLRVGDVILCGQYYGKVRALINEDGKRLKEAGPSVAVKVLGMTGVPEAGLEFAVVENDKLARAEAEDRAAKNRLLELEKREPPRVDWDQIISDSKELKVVVKGDTQGSVEAIVEALDEIESEKVKLQVVHSAVGTITESDVSLASASKAMIIGFHTRVDGEAAEVAKREGVGIKLYAIIYELIDEVKDAMAGLLEPILRENVVGAAEVRKIFALSKGGNVAGCMVTQGRIVRGKVRIVRRKNVIFEGVTQSLRRFQDEVNEVRAGMECGIRLEGFNEFQEGDSIECYTLERVAQKL